jgi:RNA polymerase sigma-32 factor
MPAQNYCVHELAGKFGISRERVRQIEVRAFQKVQHAARSRAGCAPNTTGRRARTVRPLP